MRYTRNPASQILTETQSNDTYSWNAHVNLTRAYAVNGLNQYVSAGGAAFCYDANGNLTADGGSVYLYDIENRLVEKRVQGAGNSNCAALAYTGALQAELRYDPTGRLYQVTGGTLGTQRFVYDGNAMVAEYNSVGTMLRRYVHGSNVDADDPLIDYEGAAVSDSARRYLHADPRGSIVAVTNYQGTAIATNSYDEFGIPDSASGTDIASKGRSAIPVRPGCRNWACITTRRGSTRPRWAGSSRPIRLGMRTSIISMLMSAMIR